ncbi:MAG: hypothetical protein EBR82_64620 [Caulobacteraceae bacterium]|nr:hypothetical protein [Caulobacteraceae bacterium]
MNFEEKRKAVMLDLLALAELKTPNARKSYLSVKSGKYDSEISDFGGGRIDQLTDLLISLEGIK